VVPTFFFIINSSEPQGSHIELILFILFINDLHFFIC